MKEENFIGANGLKLNTYIFDDVKKPIATVLIIHGMQEHAGRYTEFANYLNSKNIIVYASDLRGHGKTAGEIQGYDSGDIFALTLQDQNIILNEIRKKYNLPIFILGHSYGSFLTQALIRQNTAVNGFILSGSTYTATMLMKSAKLLSALSGLTGDKKPATLIENMSLKAYGKTFENGNWLSRDEDIWKKYQEDRFCGKPFPVAFYKSFFPHITKNYKGIENINKTVPILLLGGTKDPVSNMGTGLVDLYNTYKKAGLNVEIKQYTDARHEILNETNKQEVYADILNFINNIAK